MVLWKRCREIGTKMFLDLTRVIARTNPGIAYGMIYSSSGSDVADVRCKRPNDRPDSTINRLSFFIILRNDSLNTSSSRRGANKIDKIVV